MLFRRLRLVFAFVVGVIPLRILFHLCYMISPMFKYTKKYKLLNWIDQTILHLIGVTMAVSQKIFDVNGDDIMKWIRGPTLIMSNHVNMYDSLLFFAMPGIYNSRAFFYVSAEKDQLKLVDEALVARENYFGKSQISDNALRYEQHLKNHFFPMYQLCMSYPEGGVYFKVAKKSEEYAKANNIPQFKHLALPRINGLLVALNALAPIGEDASQHGQRLKFLADITLIYSDKNLAWNQIFIGAAKKTDLYLYTKVYDINEIPRDLELLKKWVFERFHEKDTILENFQVHGKLPTDQPLKSPFIITPEAVIFYTLYLFSLYSYVFIPLLSLIMKCFT